MNELKLDSFFTEKFFAIPTQPIEKIDLNFPMPSDEIQYFNEFLYTQSKIKEYKEDNLNFFAGVDSLLKELQEWCTSNLKDQCNIHNLNTLFIPFTYHGISLIDVENETEEKRKIRCAHEMRIFQLFKNGVFYLGMIIEYLRTTEINLELKQQIINELLTSLPDNTCPTGCNSVLHHTFMKFSSNFASQLMYLRQNISEQTMLALLKEHGLEDNGDNVMEKHFAVVPSIFWKQLGIGREEKEDIYANDIIKLLNSPEENWGKGEYAEVARIVKYHFPISISKTLTPAMVLDSLFDFAIPMNNLSFTLNEVLLQLADERTKFPQGFDYTQVNQKMEWLEALLNYFGIDEYFSLESMFEKKILNEETYETVFYLHPAILIKSNVETSLLQRLGHNNYFHLTNYKEAILLNEKCTLFIKTLYPLNFSYVEDWNNHHRFSLLQFALQDFNNNEPKLPRIKLLAKEIKISNFIELCEDIFIYLNQCDSRKNINSALHAFVNFIEKRTILYNHFTTSTQPLYNLFDLAARYNFKDFLRAYQFTTENFGLAQLHHHRAIKTAAQYQHWSIVKKLLKYYAPREIQQINEVLFTALHYKQNNIVIYFLASFLEETDKGETLVKALSDNLIELYFYVINYCCTGKFYHPVLATILPVIETKLTDLLDETHPINFLEYVFFNCGMEFISAFSSLINEKNNFITIDHNILEYILRIISQFSDFNDRLIALCKIVGKEETYQIFVSHTWDTKIIDENKLTNLLEESSIPKNKFLPLYINKILPAIIQKNNKHLLQQIIRKYPEILQHIHPFVLDRFMTPISWDCWWLLYKANPQQFFYQYTLTAMLIDGRIDLATTILQQNKIARRNLLNFYSRNTVDLWNKKYDAKKLLLLHLCASNSFLICKNLLNDIVNSIPDNLFVSVLGLQINEDTVFGKIFIPPLFEILLPHLTESFLRSSLFLTTLDCKIVSSNGTNHYIDLLLQYPLVLENYYNHAKLNLKANLLMELIEKTFRISSLNPYFLDNITNKNKINLTKLCFENPENYYRHIYESIFIHAMDNQDSSLLASLLEIYCNTNRSGYFPHSSLPSFNSIINNKYKLFFYTSYIYWIFGGKTFSHLSNYSKEYFDYFVKQFLRTEREPEYQLFCNTKLRLFLKKANTKLICQTIKNNSVRGGIKRTSALNQEFNLEEMFKFIIIHAPMLFEAKSFQNLFFEIYVTNPNLKNFQAINLILQGSLKTREEIELIFPLCEEAILHAIASYNKELINLWLFKLNILIDRSEVSNIYDKFRMLRAQLALNSLPEKPELINSIQLDMHEAKNTFTSDMIFRSEFFHKFYPHSSTLQCLSLDLLANAVNKGSAIAFNILQKRINKIINVNIPHRNFKPYVDQAVATLKTSLLSNKSQQSIENALHMLIQKQKNRLSFFTPKLDKSLKNYLFLLNNNSDPFIKKIIIYALLVALTPALFDKITQLAKCSALEKSRLCHIYKDDILKFLGTKIASEECSPLLDKILLRLNTIIETSNQDALNKFAEELEIKLGLSAPRVSL